MCAPSIWPMPEAAVACARPDARFSGKSIQDMLSDFIADGGTVIMCAACSKAAGLQAADYIDGVQMGTWPLVESILFNPDVTTLAW